MSEWTLLCDYERDVAHAVWVSDFAYDNGRVMPGWYRPGDLPLVETAYGEDTVGRGAIRDSGAFVMWRKVADRPEPPEPPGEGRMTHDSDSVVVARLRALEKEEFPADGGGWTAATSAELMCRDGHWEVWVWDGGMVVWRSGRWHSIGGAMEHAESVAREPEPEKPLIQRVCEWLWVAPECSSDIRASWWADVASGKKMLLNRDALLWRIQMALVEKGYSVLHDESLPKVGVRVWCGEGVTIHSETGLAVTAALLDVARQIMEMEG